MTMMLMLGAIEKNNNRAEGASLVCLALMDEVGEEEEVEEVEEDAKILVRVFLMELEATRPKKSASSLKTPVEA